MFAKKLTLSLLGLVVIVLIAVIVFALASEGSEQFITICPLH